MAHSELGARFGAQLSQDAFVSGCLVVMISSKADIYNRRCLSLLSELIIQLIGNSIGLAILSSLPHRKKYSDSNHTHPKHQPTSPHLNMVNSLGLSAAGSRLPSQSPPTNISKPKNIVYTNEKPETTSQDPPKSGKMATLKSMFKNDDSTKRAPSVASTSAESPLLGSL